MKALGGLGYFGQISEEQLKDIEQFVYDMYGKGQLNSVNEARLKEKESCYHFMCYQNGWEHIAAMFTSSGRKSQAC